MADMKNKNRAQEIAEERLKWIAPLLQPDPGGRPFPRLNSPDKSSGKLAVDYGPDWPGIMSLLAGDYDCMQKKNL